jgi:hypothetical protein
MVGPDDERTPPQVGTPVTNSLDKTDELTLICRDLEMTGREWLVEEHDGALSLVQHHAKARSRCITIHHKVPAEI